VQFGSASCKVLWQIVLKRELGRRSQEAGVHAIFQAVALFRNKLNLSRCAAGARLAVYS